jgi:uncharacterized repeat protein (TIGR01451 family)
MKALRFVLVAAVVAVAGLAAAVPAGATDNTNNTNNTNSTNKILPPKNPGPVAIIHCPRDGGLELFKTADKSDYHPNDIVTFTLTVQASVCDAAQVAVHDQLPVGLIVSDPSVLDHSFGSVAAGTEKSFSFQAVAVTKGQWTNTAHASGFAVGYDETGLPCNIVRPPVVPPLPVLSTEVRVIQPPYSCARSADAEVTIDVTAPSGNTPPTTPPTKPPSQPPTNSGTPSLPNTGRQG